MRRPAPLPSFLLLYALVYGAFGASSPFMPRFFESRDIGPEGIGLLFGLGTAVRIVSAPLAGRIADLLGAVRTVLACCCVSAAVGALALVGAAGFPALLLVFVVQGALLAPVTTLADALAVAAATPRRAARGGFEYGRVRGAASAAFVAGSLAAGQALGRAPLDAVLWMQAALLAAATLGVRLVPPLDARGEPATAAEASPLGGLRELLGLAAFRRLVLVAALVLGSHAMHDGFAMVRWNAAGIGPAAASILWSESVVAEVIVFTRIGPAVVDRLGVAGAAGCAALAGVVRWLVTSQTAALVAVACVQPLHGLTFALLHLAAMRLIARAVPARLAATAQGVYALGATTATALLMPASGALYARFGARAFAAMAALCAIALPLARGLEPARRTPSRDAA